MIMKRILVAMLLFVPIVFAQEAPKAKPSQEAPKAKPSQEAPKAKLSQEAPTQEAPKAKPSQEAPKAKPSQEAPKAKLSEAEVKARTDKRRAMQWYVIELMTPCVAGSDKKNRYGRFKSRLEASTLEELTGLDPKSTNDLDPNLKDYLKQVIVDDLIEMYQKGACKESIGSSNN
jgi:membrane protein involved in colicin uptake